MECFENRFGRISQQKKVWRSLKAALLHVKLSTVISRYHAQAKIFAKREFLKKFHFFVSQINLLAKPCTLLIS
jgi:hypothetical protein